MIGDRVPKNETQTGGRVPWWLALQIRLPLLWRARVAAARALAGYTSLRSIALLAAASTDRHPAVGMTAIAALTELGRASSGTLVEALWNSGVRYEAARTRMRLLMEVGQLASGSAGARLKAGQAEDQAAAIRKMTQELAEARALSPLDPRTYYLAGMLSLRNAPVDKGDGLIRFASRLAPGWANVPYHVGNYFSARWHMDGRRDERLFEEMARNFSLAIRSPGTRDAAIRRVLDLVTAPARVDKLLRPDAGIEAALDEAPEEELRGVIRELAGFRSMPADAGLLANFWRRKLDVYGPAARLPLARMKLALGRNDAALTHLIEYARAFRDAGAFAECARLASRQRDLKLAASLAAQAAQLDPDRAAHQLLLADMLRRLGRDGNAVVSYRKALLLEPRNLRAARGLSGLEVKAGRYPEAVSVWRRFMDAGGDAAAAHEAVADIYLRLLDRARAAEELEKAVELKPRDERLRKRLEQLRR